MPRARRTASRSPSPSARPRPRSPAPRLGRLNQGSTCTATVSDTDSGTKSFPTGTVTFSALQLRRVQLARPARSAQVGATTTSSCERHVHAYRERRRAHDQRRLRRARPQPRADSDGFNLTVTKRATSTTVTCAPRSVALNQASTCTATVADTDSGTKSSRPGRSPSARAPARVHAGTSCTLAPGRRHPDLVLLGHYTPTASAGVHTIKGAYQGTPCTGSARTTTTSP